MPSASSAWIEYYQLLIFILAWPWVKFNGKMEHPVDQYFVFIVVVFFVCFTSFLYVLPATNLAR